MRQRQDWKYQAALHLASYAMSEHQIANLIDMSVSEVNDCLRCKPDDKFFKETKEVIPCVQGIKRLAKRQAIAIIKRRYQAPQTLAICHIAAGSGSLKYAEHKRFRELDSRD